MSEDEPKIRLVASNDIEEEEDEGPEAIEFAAFINSFSDSHITAVDECLQKLGATMGLLRMMRETILNLPDVVEDFIYEEEE